MLYKFYGDKIRISVKPRRFIFISLGMENTKRSS
jgi:hypothetical protein